MTEEKLLCTCCALFHPFPSQPPAFCLEQASWNVWHFEDGSHCKDGRAKQKETGFFVTARSFQTCPGRMAYLHLYVKEKLYPVSGTSISAQTQLHLVMQTVIPNFQCSLKVFILPSIEKYQE